MDLGIKPEVKERQSLTVDLPKDIYERLEAHARLDWRDSSLKHIAEEILRGYTEIEVPSFEKKRQRSDPEQSKASTSAKGKAQAAGGEK